MNDDISQGNGLFAQLVRKLDAIETKQDRMAEQHHSATLAMVRVEERQKSIADQLEKGAISFKDQDTRIESLEKSRDKVNTVIGVLTGLWTSLTAFGMWLYANISFTIKPPH